MVEIDLHGYTYDEVRDKLPNKVILHYNMGNTPIRVITGNSEKMKETVKECVEEHGFTTEIDWLSGNHGSIIVK